ncbi:MAG: hypothetical protein PVH84_13350 [Candidatus Aminicenantes bacterium]
MEDRVHTVKVKYYSGYKGEETPRSVLVEGEELPIDRILERKKILVPGTNELRREFTIQLKGRLAVLKISSSGLGELTELS